MSSSSRKTIKRYRNRKLYDTSDSCYITLEDIGEMIRMGEDIRVIDNTSKEDITSVTLAQIIFEEQKKKTNVQSTGTLRQIIQGGQEALKDLVTIGAREITHMREFVDDKVIPTVNGLQTLPDIKREIGDLRKRISHLENMIRSKVKRK